MNYCKAILDRDATSKRIKKVISESIYTIEEIAEALQLGSSRVIYDWYNGIKLPNLENLYNLALIFNKKMEDFLILR